MGIAEGSQLPSGDRRLIFIRYFLGLGVQEGRHTRNSYRPPTPDFWLWRSSFR